MKTWYNLEHLKYRSFILVVFIFYVNMGDTKFLAKFKRLHQLLSMLPCLGNKTSPKAVPLGSPVRRPSTHMPFSKTSQLLKPILSFV